MSPNQIVATGARFDCTAKMVGSRNTCTNPSDKVWQIRGEERTMEIRVCPSCMEKIQQVVGPVRKRKD